MNEFVEAMKKEINEKSNMFDIGYNMIQYYIDKYNMEDMNYGDLANNLDDIDERLLFILLLKNLISQVNNGGFYQYFDNGYASYEKRSNGDLDAHSDLIKLFEKYIPRNEKTEKLLQLLYNFQNDIHNDCCDECDGSGYIEEEHECSECNGEGYIDGEECYRCDGSGYIEEEYECSSCMGRGELASVSYYGNDDNNFYDICDEDMENFFKKIFIDWIENWEKDCSLNQFNKKENNASSKPRLKLVGIDGNAFNIIGELIKALRHGGYSNERIKEIQEECMSSDYNNLLATCCKYCDVY